MSTASGVRCHWFFSAALIVWAAGVVLGEGLAQAGALATLALALAGYRRASLADDVRRYCAASLALSAWQALSPAVALSRGLVPAWPPSGRYGQALDTLAGAAAGVAAAGEVPWAALAVVLGAGWLLSVALGTYQHFVRWPFGQPPLVGSPVARVQEVFSVGGAARYAAGGFQFHRLRFAHGAVATLGEALALAAAKPSPRVRLSAGAVAAALLLGIYFSYARAALLVALALVVAFGLGAGLWAGRRRALVWTLGGAAALAALALTSPAWQRRIALGRENLEDGGRHAAMAAGLTLARAQPLLGVGFGDYKPAALAAVPRPQLPEALASDAHDLWLTVWAETGLLGLGLLLLQQALLALALSRRARAGSWPAVGGLLAQAGFLGLSLVHYPPYHTGVMLSFGLFCGLGLAPVTSVRWPGGRSPTSPSTSPSGG